MKKIGSIAVIVIAGVALLWMAGMSLLNAQTTRLQVHVTGTVDEVRIFHNNDTVNPVAIIETAGRDTTQVIHLRSAEGPSPFHQTSPASYFFTTRQSDQVFPGKKICCETGLFPHRLTLTITGPEEWQLTDR